MVTWFGIVWLVGHGCRTAELFMWRRSVQVRIVHLARGCSLSTRTSKGHDAANHQPDEWRAQQCEKHRTPRTVVAAGTTASARTGGCAVLSSPHAGRRRRRDYALAGSILLVGFEIYVEPEEARAGQFQVT
jgi:hypothetical protein